MVEGIDPIATTRWSVTLGGVRDRVGGSVETAQHRTESRTHRLFNTVVPIAILADLSLGLFLLLGLGPLSWQTLLKVGTGALLCAAAGGLAAAALSQFYWSRNMACQIALWRRISDAIFVWLEDVQLPAEALRTLQSALDEATASYSGRPKLRRQR